RSPLICIHLFFFLLLPPPPTSTLFPYTTLFRSLLVSATVAGAQGLTINHDEVGCLVAGKYPKLQACFTPAGDVKQARVYFRAQGDRKSTRLNSSHQIISYAVFCLKKKKKKEKQQ